MLQIFVLQYILPLSLSLSLSLSFFLSLSLSLSSTPPFPPTSHFLSISLCIFFSHSPTPPYFYLPLCLCMYVCLSSSGSICFFLSPYILPLCFLFPSPSFPFSFITSHTLLTIGFGFFRPNHSRSSNFYIITSSTKQATPPICLHCNVPHVCTVPVSSLLIQFRSFLG